MRKKLSALLGLWMLLLLLAGQSVFAAAPKINAAITEKNILALMDVYDRDGAYLLRTMHKSGDSILSWWQGCRTIVEGIDTGVHEEFHGYSYRKAPWNAEDIYIGSQKYVRVRFTSVFSSKKMSASIPSKLRTARWGPYIGKPISGLASNVDGIYGLLNEFTAYYWGMHAQMSLYEYYKTNKATPAQWLQFINSCANDRLAYTEFRYYMLQYLAYAKEHNRSVYNGIISNSSFVKAWQTIDGKFAALISQFEGRMQDIAALLKKDGHSVRIGEFYYIDGYGVGIFQKDYDSLTAEMKKPAYKNILKGSSSSGSAKVGGTSVTSLSRTKSGAQLKWKKASGASGYYVYRKAAGEKSYKKVKTVSGTSWTDKSVKKGKKYSYKIIPYSKKGTKITRGKASAVKSLRA